MGLHLARVFAGKIYLEQAFSRRLTKDLVPTRFRCVFYCSFCLLGKDIKPSIFSCKIMMMTSVTMTTIMPPFLTLSYSLNNFFIFVCRSYLFCFRDQYLRQYAGHCIYSTLFRPLKGLMIVLDCRFVLFFSLFCLPDEW